MAAMMKPGMKPGTTPEAAMEAGMESGEMQSFYIPGYEGIKPGDTVSLKVVGLDEDNGDLEVEWIGKVGGTKERYEPEEPPEDAFTGPETLM